MDSSAFIQLVLSPPNIPFSPHNKFFTGHYTIGGDPGGDFFGSPGDPAFWLHHAQIDRVWWIWQNQNLPERQNAISGTITLSNVPPSRNGTLDDLLDLGVLGDVRTIGEVMDTTGGPFCYIYV